MNESTPINSVFVKCPVCGQNIPENPGYITWCDNCSWNINPNNNELYNDIRYKIYKFLGKMLSLKLFNSIKSNDLTKKYFSLTRVITILFAILIYSFSLGLLISVFGGGLFLIIRGTFLNKFPSDYAFVFFGLLCLAITYFIVPKFKKHEANYVKREEYKTLFQLIDKISNCMGTKKIDEVCINEEFNASFYKTFFKGKRILTIGLPMFVILSSEEKVALLSHEIAHSANMDITRGRFIGGAYNLLIKWYRVLRPNRGIGELGFSILIGPFLICIINPIRWILSKIVLGIWYIYAILLWRDNQRSEYLADYLASEVAGNEAMSSLLHKFHYGESFWSLMRKIHKYGYSKDLLSEYKKKTMFIPERELHRIERLDTEFLNSVDATHPPTKYRINLMKEYRHKARLVINDFEKRLLEDELNKASTNINEKIIRILNSLG